MTKIEKCLGRFNVLDFGAESTTSLPLFLSYECFNSGTKNLLGAKVVLVDQRLTLRQSTSLIKRSAA